MAFIYLLLALGHMATIYWLSSLPGDVDAETAGLAGIIAWTPPAVQNLLHVPVYGLLAWLWYRTLTASHIRHLHALLAALLLAAGYGVFDEWHQLHVPGRYASLTDMALNGAGVMLALWWLHRRNHRAGG